MAAFVLITVLLTIAGFVVVRPWKNPRWPMDGFATAALFWIINSTLHSHPLPEESFSMARTFTWIYWIALWYAVWWLTRRQERKTTLLEKGM